MKQATAPVSVVIPAYNIEKYLPQTLESIFGQTLLPEEVIVINDGSSDRSSEIARSYGAIVYDQENRGLSAARNAGLRSAKSDWVAFLDGDDIWAPQKLARQIDAVAVDPSSAFVFTDFWQFNGSDIINHSVVHEVHSSFVNLKRTELGNNIWRFDQEELSIFLPRNCMMVPSTWMIKTELLRTLGGCDETLKYSEDIELELRLLANTAALFVDEALVGYRRHGSAMTANQLHMRRGDIDVANRVYSNPSAYLESTFHWFVAEKASILEKGGRMAVVYGDGMQARIWLSESLALQRKIAPALWFLASFISGSAFSKRILQQAKQFWFAIRTIRTKFRR